MKCYICDTETDFIDKRDNKPVCEECQEAVREVMNEWYEDSYSEEGSEEFVEEGDGS